MPHKNRDERNAYVRQWNRQLRKDVLVVFGGKCEKCGFEDQRALQIDHKHGNGYEERMRLKTNGLHRKVLGMTKSEIKNEYQLLCANCNVIKKVVNREVRGFRNLSSAKRAIRWVCVRGKNTRGLQAVQSQKIKVA